MSCYIKINSWSGDDSEEATSHLGKVFRMDSEEADQVLREILDGQTWQFQWTVADHQAYIAQSYLNRLGFNLELIHSDPSSEPGSKPSVESLVYEEPPKKKSWLDFFKGKPKTPAEQTETIGKAEPAAEKPPRKSLFSFSFGKKEAPEPVSEEMPSPEPAAEEKPQRKSLSSFLTKKS